MNNLLFTTPFCSNCKPLKKQLQDRGIEYEEVNAIQQKELVEKYGVKGVPSMVVREYSEDHGEVFQTLTSEAIKAIYINAE